ncbi:LysM peptidoglycan-binding domain-containing protein, partial [Novosphingobium sp. AAP93]|uniref:LysM peptidoglycan-binding domain-containing protein n=1 Tax=Novosphingobium sp. AAP93 TaxID=1523427 RepID=UPI001E3FCA8D
MGAAEAATTSYTYDGLGNVISVTDPRGNTTYSYYDVMGRLNLTRDAEDYVTKTSYTNFSEVASVTRYVTRTTSAVTVAPTVTPVSGQDAATTFAYDKLGRLIKTTDAEGKFESQTYNAFGEIDTKTNKLGGTTTNTYDRRGLLSAETMAMTSVDRTGTQQAASVTNTYAYNAFGNRLTMVEAAGLAEARTTGYSYDRNGRLVSVTGTSVPVLYGNATVTPSEGTAITKTVTSYDARGNVIETAVKVTSYNATGTLLTTDVAQSRTLAWYDQLGRKTDELTAGSLITKGTLSHWTYDARGNVFSTSVYGDEVTIATTRPTTAPAAVNGANVRTTSYTYDKLDRLKTTSMANVLVGSCSGSSYSYTTQTVTTTKYYDAAGNLIRQTDGRGDNTYFYYDRLNRKTAQVDRENYLTTWALDEDGNTVDEVRYAGKVVGTVTTVAAPTVSADSANDRSTHFTYDRMGRRLTEERAGAIKASQDANGVVMQDTSPSRNVVTTTATSVITYSYNGLGEVTSKKEATGDTTTYTYDSMGRMTKETDPSQPISGGTTGSPVTQFWYDGLGNLTRSDENGRVTQYQYYASGKLKALTNADSVTRTYFYDGAGNKVAEKYLRTGADSTATASSVYDAMTYTYDAAGRLTAQGYATVTGTTWAAAANSDTTSVGYNAYGEVIGRGINLTSAQIAAGAYQDKFSYDNAGHMWRSTAGDGTVNLYVYDENGNQTLDITSSGKDKLAATDTTTTDALPGSYVWANPATGQTQLDLTAALNLLTNNGANTVGAAVVQGMIVTQSLYDGRNQLTQIRMPLRDRTSLGSYSASPYTNLKSYNAFGEVTSETDARGNVTNYAYNTLGRVIKRELPAVSWTAENGTIASARPTENYFYDISGRVVGVQDANGNVNTRTLLAGTGYGKDSEALVLKEFHADGGVFERQYDLHHDLKVTINEVGKTETYVYDALGQLIEQDHQIRAAGSPGNDLTGAVAVQLKDYYDYDNLGHRTLHTNSQLGSAVKETTAYDIQGRVTSQVDLGGDTTSYSYAWNGSLVTSGLGTFGGWTKVTTNSSLKTRTDVTDYYGRTIDMIDYGGHNYDYTFDLSGRLVGRVSNQGESITWSYYNTGMMQSQVSTYGNAYYGSTITATYQYDADNHRTFEGYDATTNTINWYTGATYNNVVHHQHANVTWDAAGRMTQFKDTGDQGSAPVQVDWEYDLNGNIRHMAASYRAIDDQGNIGTTATTQDYWYLYDKMNRFITTKGILVGTKSDGTVVTGSAARGLQDAAIKRSYGQIYGSSYLQGADILYDSAGNRKSVTRTLRLQTGSGMFVVPYLADQKEVYNYSDDGFLSQVTIGVGSITAPNDTTTSAVVRARYLRDAMGRVTDYREYGAGGYVSTNPATNVVYQRTASYNNKGLVTSDVVTSVQGVDTFVNSTTYYYNANETAAGSGQWKGVTSGGTYMGGAVTLSSTTVTKNGAAQTGNSTTNTFAWWGSAMQAVANYVSGSTSNTSTFNYDQSGHLQSVYIQDGRPRTVSFVTDVSGQILTRQESDNNATQGDPKELHYYFNGMGVGDISNNGTSDVDYAASIAQHTAVSAGYGAFRNGATTGSSYADFDQSYDPINGLNYASTSSRYVVQDGDTLTSIAQAVWGDASFWYLIADANGLDGTETLAAGQSLILPNKVHNSHNNTSTYRVYDPNEAIGDTAPTAVAPPKDPACGGFGAILLGIIAIVVTAIVAPEL